MHFFIMMSSLWQAEKMKRVKINELKSKIENAKFELEKAQREGNLAKAGEITYGKIPEFQNELLKLEASSSDNILREAVSEDDIANIIAKITGIPLDKIISGEKEKLLKMEDLLRKRVVGQDYALTAISNAVRRARGLGRSAGEKSRGMLRSAPDRRKPASPTPFPSPPGEGLRHTSPVGRGHAARG